MMRERTDLGFVHRFVRATGPGARSALLLLHGTGGNEEDLLSAGAALAPGTALLSPRGKVLENGLPRFFRRLAEGVFDEEDIKMRAAALARFVSAAAAGYGLDPQRIYAAGYSNGANIAVALLLLEPATLAGAVLFRPMIPLLPPTQPGVAGKPVFISAGRTDPIAPPAQPEGLAAMLTVLGASVELNWVDAGHNLDPGEIEKARSWLAPLLRG